MSTICTATCEFFISSTLSKDGWDYGIKDVREHPSEGGGTLIKIRSTYAPQVGKLTKMLPCL